MLYIINILILNKCLIPKQIIKINKSKTPLKHQILPKSNLNLIININIITLLKLKSPILNYYTLPTTIINHLLINNLIINLILKPTVHHLIIQPIIIPIASLNQHLLLKILSKKFIFIRKIIKINNKTNKKLIKLTNINSKINF